MKAPTRSDHNRFILIAIAFALAFLLYGHANAAPVRPPAPGQPTSTAVVPRATPTPDNGCIMSRIPQRNNCNVRKYHYTKPGRNPRS